MIELFLSTLNQMAFLFSLMLIGYLLVKFRCVPDASATTLSNLENIVLVPALIMGTFMQNFTVETLSTAWKFLLMSVALALVTLPLAYWIGKLCFKDKLSQKLSAYGLCFSNFGFMGNAVVKALFPEIFMEYVIFTIPFWTFAYVWGVPTLLIPHTEGEKHSFASSLKNLVNPMFVCLLIGAVIGLTGIWLPPFVSGVIEAAGNCMSPVAMILTGILLARIDLKALLKKWRVYLVSAARLVLFPLLFILVFVFVPQNSFVTETFLICGMNIMAMPAGLTAVFVPSAYGEDSTPAAEFALVSHVLSVATIPLMFMLFQAVVL